MAYLNPTGGPALAQGGTGDILAGLAAGLLAQGFSPLDAGALAAFWHGRAGDLASEEKGPRASTIQDILAKL
jgi:NAD(P)H-hydrate repair Nnr-like enzyme with NAD(P)H-hydrate dehydratase domain